MSDKKEVPPPGSLLQEVVNQAVKRESLEDAMKKAHEVMNLHQQIKALQVGILNRESELIMAGRKIAELMGELDNAKGSMQLAINGLRSWEDAAREYAKGDTDAMEALISEVAQSEGDEP